MTLIEFVYRLMIRAFFGFTVYAVTESVIAATLVALMIRFEERKTEDLS